MNQMKHRSLFTVILLVLVILIGTLITIMTIECFESLSQDQQSTTIRQCASQAELRSVVSRLSNLETDHKSAIARLSVESANSQTDIARLIEKVDTLDKTVKQIEQQYMRTRAKQTNTNCWNGVCR